MHEQASLVYISAPVEKKLHPKSFARAPNPVRDITVQTSVFQILWFDGELFFQKLFFIFN